MPASPSATQGRAASLQPALGGDARCGIPDADLAALEQEWTYSQGARLFTWAPASGSRARRDQWTAGRSRPDTIWAHDLTLTGGGGGRRPELHTVLGTESESPGQGPLRCAGRCDQPGDSRTCWRTGRGSPRLVPVDRRIASATVPWRPGGAGQEPGHPQRSLRRSSGGPTRTATWNLSSAWPGRAPDTGPGVRGQGPPRAASMPPQPPNRLSSTPRACLRGRVFTGISCGLYQGRIDVTMARTAAAATAAEFQSHQRI